MLNRKKFKIFSIVAILIISVVLNIILLSTDVYQGTYTAHLKGDYTASVDFFDNTYTLKVEKPNGRYEKFQNGFFVSREKESYIDNPKDDIVILYHPTESYESSTYYFYRKNVFCLKYAPYGNSTFKGNNAYCYEAIFLQVLYSLLILISSVILIREYIKTKKEQKT